jgi:hypothetical protein
MADLAGELCIGNHLILSYPGLSVNVQFTPFPIYGLSLVDVIAGIPVSEYSADLDAGQSPAPGMSIDGEELGLFELLFDKIIVTPRRKDCGFVAANISWLTDVWNTHRNSPKSIEGCVITGSGNVIVNNPAGFPIPLWPLQSHAFETVVPGEGDAIISGLVSFTVTDETGATLIIVGQRIIIFAIEPDWSEPFKEKTQYLTNVLAGYSGKEQRITLRKNPRVFLEYQTMAIDSKTAAALEALIYGWQARVFGVPFWPDAQKITQSSNQGSRIIYCETTNRKFRQGGSALLWRDFFTNEAAAIESFDSSSLTVSAPLNASWPADGLTYVIPVLTGYWSGEAMVGRLSPCASELVAAFQCFAQPDVAAASPQIVYGYDVLDVMPNAVQDRDNKYSRLLKSIDSVTGTFGQIDRSGVAIGQPGGFLWTMASREEIAAYRSWMALRKGRAQAFWLPTWQHDLVQADLLAAGSASLIVKPTGYTRFQFPHTARRYLCFSMLDGSSTRYCRRITNAQDNGGSETLTLSSALFPDRILQPGECMISFLHLVRLATDEPELVFHSRDVAEVQLDCVEVPLEISS